MTKRRNLFQYVSDAGTVSLDRQPDGTVTLSVQLNGAQDRPQAPLPLPIDAVKGLGDAARFEALLHKGEGD